jgi:hypothetical protein
MKKSAKEKIICRIGFLVVFDVAVVFLVWLGEVVIVVVCCSLI